MNLWWYVSYVDPYEFVNEFVYILLLLLLYAKVCDCGADDCLWLKSVAMVLFMLYNAMSVESGYITIICIDIWNGVCGVLKYGPAF